MKENKYLRIGSLLVPICLMLAACKPTVDPFAGLAAKVIVAPNLTYLKINDSTELKCNVYYPGTNLGEEPWVKVDSILKPTLLYIHGGAWINLDKDIRTVDFMPFVAKGWCVVSIDYRLITKAPFPACIADCRNALNWIYDNAAKFRFDTNRIVVSGESAGGHLSLMTGMLENDNVIYNPGHKINRKLKVAAIINWYGVSYMDEILKVQNDFTMKIAGDTSKIEFIKKIASPVNYVKSGLPPIMSIHGDIDPVVPYVHSVKLHNLLDSVKVKNKLVTIKGRKHGDFDVNERNYIFDQIWKFLDDIGVTRKD